MNMAGNGGFASNILTLDKDNWDRWSALMRSLFGAQDVLEIVQNGYDDLVANANDAQRATHREAKKKDCKPLFYMQQNVDAYHFEKINKCVKAKEAWDILVRYHDGDAKVKQVKLQSIRRRFEMMQMQEDQRIGEYISNIMRLVNQMRSCGAKITDQSVVEKILRSLNTKFDFVVVSILEAKDKIID
jgi:hypothetical protein